MALPDRALWAKMRDGAKVPPEFTKANMTVLLDGVDQTKVKDFKLRYVNCVKLSKAALEYYIALKKSKDPHHQKFLPIFEKKVFQEIRKLELSLRAIAVPTKKLNVLVDQVMAGAKGVKTAKDWTKFWAGPVRGVAATVPSCAKLDKKFGPVLLKSWPATIGSKAYLVKGEKNDNDRAACLKEVYDAALRIEKFGTSMKWW